MKGGEGFHQTVSFYPRTEHARRAKHIDGNGNLITASNVPDGSGLGLPPRGAGAPHLRHSGGPVRPSNSGDDVVSVGSNRMGTTPQQWTHQAGLPVMNQSVNGGHPPVDRPAAAPGQGGGLGAVQMSLQDMLTAAARIQSELMASTTASRAPAEATSPRAPGGSQLQPQPYTAAASALLPQRPAPPPAQSRGPLEALRDELFGGLLHSASSAGAGPPFPPAAPPVGPLSAAVAAAVGSPPRSGRAALDTADTAVASPAPSVMAPTDPGTAPLQEEMSALTAQAGHSYADLSSIYSIPDSSMTAAARTPMSFTTAAVSDLDTPSSARSRDEEYDKSYASPAWSPERGRRGRSASGGRPAVSGPLEYDRIASGYDDYVSPGSWMSLREQHSTSHARATSTVSGPEMGYGGYGGGASAASTPTGPSAWASGGVDLLASTAPTAPPPPPSPPPPPASPALSTASVANAPSDADVGRAANTGGEYVPRRPQDLQQPLPPQQLQQQQHRPPSGSRPDIVALIPPPPPMQQQLTLSLDGSSPSSGPPTAFGSIVMPDSRGRERISSGHLYCSLSFGVPSGAASIGSSGTASRHEGDEGGGAAGAGAPQLLPGQELSLRTSAVSRVADAAAARDGGSGGAAAAAAQDHGDGHDDPGSRYDDTARGRYVGTTTFTNPLFVEGSYEGSHSAGPSASVGDGASSVGSGSVGGGYTSPRNGAGGVGAAGTPPPTAREGATAAAAAAEDEQLVGGVKRGGDPEPGRPRQPGSLDASPRAGAVSSSGVTAADPGPAPQRHLSRTHSGPAAQSGPGASAADASAAPSSAQSAAETEGNDHLQPLPLARSPSLSNVLTPASPPPATGAGGRAGVVTAAAPPPLSDPFVEAGGGSSHVARGLGVSAAALGAVPEQDRGERVRSWTQVGADFGSRPRGSTSNGGAPPNAALTPDPSREGDFAVAAAAAGMGGSAAGPEAIDNHAEAFTAPSAAAASAAAAAASEYGRQDLIASPYAVSVRALTAAADEAGGRAAAAAAGGVGLAGSGERHSATASTLNAGAPSDGAHAPLEHLLSLLSGRGARSEALGQALLSDTLGSAVFDAVSLPRPNSAPVLSSVASGHVDGAETPLSPSGGGASGDAAEAAHGAGGLRSAAASLALANGGAGEDSIQIQIPGGSGSVGSRLLARASHGLGLPEHPHPHLQPHLPLNPHGSQPQLKAQQSSQPDQQQTQQQQQQQPAGSSAGRQPPAPGAAAAAAGVLQPISPAGSLGSVDSEVATERLKAKMRSYLQAAEANGGGRPETSSGASSAAALGAAAPPPPPPLSMLDALLQQATQHLHAAADPTAAASGAAQPSLSALEDVLRQLRQLTRNSGGGGAPPQAPPGRPPPPPRPPAADADPAAAGRWARPVPYGSGGGAGSGDGAGSISVGSGFGGGGGRGSVGGFSGASGGSMGPGGEWSAAGNRMSSSVGSVSLWGASTATGSAPSRGSRAVSSPSRLGPAEAAVAAAAAAKTAAAAAAAANVLGFRPDASPHDWAAALGQPHPSPPPPSYPLQPQTAARSPRELFPPAYPPPHPASYGYGQAPYGHGGGVPPGSNGLPAENGFGHGAVGSKVDRLTSRGTRRTPPKSGTTAGAEYHGGGGGRGSGGGAGPAEAEGPSYHELTAHADQLREQLGADARQWGAELGHEQRQAAVPAAAAAAPWGYLLSPGSSPRSSGLVAGSAAPPPPQQPPQQQHLPNRRHSFAGAQQPQQDGPPHPHHISPRSSYDQILKQQRQPEVAGGRTASYNEVAPAAAAPVARGLSRSSVEWQAVLQSKLLPYDAVRSRESLIDASAALAAELPAEVAAPPPPMPAYYAGGGGGAPGPRNASSARQSRPQSPAMRRSGTRPGSAREGRSAPATPRRGNSPSRSLAGAQPAAAQPPPPYGAAAGNVGGMPSKSPRASSTLRDGRVGSGSSGSILDRATPRGSGVVGAGGGNGGGGGISPQRARSSSPLSASEPIAIVRPFAWQERETRHWLEDMGLMVNPAEECLPLLDNPLRNGLLLSGLAARVVGAPLPAGVVTNPPRDVRSARTNILCALDHLGMLAAPWAPPPDAERRARAQAAAAAGADLGHHSGSAGGGSNGGAGTGRSRSPSPARNSSAGPTAGSSGIIAIKALGSAGRGYALRLKERQLRGGLGLTAEVESVLAGSVDSIWGLLNFIRLAVAPQYQYLRGSGGSGGYAVATGAGERGGGRRPWAAEERGRRSFDVRGGVGPDGKAGPGPAPAALAAAAAAGGGSGNNSHSHSLTTIRSGRASPIRISAVVGVGSDGGYPSDNDGGGGSRHAGSPEPTPTLRGGSKVALTGGRGRLLGGPVADPRGSINMGTLMCHHTSATASVGGGAGGGGAPAGATTPTESGLLYRPLWPTLASLPYSAAEVAALESSLLQWLTESGAISRREAAQGFSSLLPMFEDGTFICWLVSNLSGKPIVGAHRRPLTDTARRTNWLKAIEALRTLPGMSRRFLVYEEALIHIERPPLTGLLEDLHRLAAGMPPAPSAVLPDAKPYLPYAVPEPVVRTLPPDRIAINRSSSPAASPVRTPTPGRGASREPPGARSRRSSPSPSPRAATPSRHSHGPAAGGTAVPAPAASAPAPPPYPHPYQQHPLFQKAVPFSSTSLPANHAVSAAELPRNGESGGPAAAAADGGGAVAGSSPNSARGGDSPGGRNRRERSASASTIPSGVRRSAAVDGGGSSGGAAGGDGGGGGRALITDVMVTPTKVFPGAGASEPQRRRRPSSANAVDLLRASFPVAAWGHPGPEGAGQLQNHLLQGGQPGNHRQPQPQRGSQRGSRSAGGAPEAFAASSSPVLSPRLRLVPSGY